jgi:hypothetical protein
MCDLFPVWPNIGADHAALCADHPRAEPPHEEVADVEIGGPHPRSSREGSSAIAAMPRRDPERLKAVVLAWVTK